MNKIIEVFRAGTQTDSKGRKKTWTKKDLDTMVSKYNEGGSGHEAPIVIGHPKTDDPAFGWVKKLSRKGDVLFAELHDVVEEFKEAFNKGMYKKRSISLYPDLTLKHVGFLGAQAPAIKGLADFKFSEEDELTEEDFHFDFGSFEEETEFADFETAWGFRDIGRFLRKFREDLIGQGRKEAADEMVPNHLVKNLEDFKETDSKKLVSDSNFEETNPKNGVEQMTELEKANAKIEELNGKIVSFSENKVELETKLAAETKRANDAEEALANFQEKAEQDEISAFCEKLVSEGKLAAGDRELTETTLHALKGSDKQMEFGEGDNKETVSAFDAMKAKLQNAESKIEFGEFKKGEKGHEKKLEFGSEFSEIGDVDQDRNKLHQKALKIAKDEGLDYSEALDKARDL